MKKHFFYFLLLSLSYLNTQATTFTFTGKYNSDWNNALNWKSPTGKPGNVNLKFNTIIIEAYCRITQGITITNYGEIIIKNKETSFEFHSIHNYGKVSFQQEKFYQALGETFKNYDGAILILPNEAIRNFCHIVNEGTIYDLDSFAKVKLSTWNSK